MGSILKGIIISHLLRWVVFIVATIVSLTFISDQCLVYVSSLNAHNSMKKVPLLLPFYRLGNWGLERLSTAKITHSLQWSKPKVVRLRAWPLSSHLFVFNALIRACFKYWRGWHSLCFRLPAGTSPHGVPSRGWVPCGQQPHYVLCPWYFVQLRHDRGNRVVRRWPSWSSDAVQCRIPTFPGDLLHSSP